MEIDWSFIICVCKCESPFYFHGYFSPDLIIAHLPPMCVTRITDTNTTTIIIIILIPTQSLCVPLFPLQMRKPTRGISHFPRYFSTVKNSLSLNSELHAANLPQSTITTKLLNLITPLYFFTELHCTKETICFSLKIREVYFFLFSTFLKSNSSCTHLLLLA
jgi:hypothetical protein